MAMPANLANFLLQQLVLRTENELEPTKEQLLDGVDVNWKKVALHYFSQSLELRAILTLEKFTEFTKTDVFQSELRPIIFSETE
jgi:hypothetical protein